METQVRRVTRHRAVGVWLTLFALLLAVTALATWARHSAPTVAVYSQDEQGDHFEGRYVCRSGGLGVECEGLSLGYGQTCRPMADGPRHETFVRCGQGHAFGSTSYPNSQPFEEAP